MKILEIEKPNRWETRQLLFCVQDHSPSNAEEELKEQVVTPPWLWFGKQLNIVLIKKLQSGELASAFIYLLQITLLLCLI